MPDEASEGTLEVTLKNATDLKDVEFLGRQDPYCVISCANINHRSKTDTDVEWHRILLEETLRSTTPASQNALEA
eukprot:gene21578-28576_t